jgi:hypothetical protein
MADACVAGSSAAMIAAATMHVVRIFRSLLLSG